MIRVPWNCQAKYLGVNIIASMEVNKLVSLNIAPLLKEMQRCFVQWDSGDFLVWAGAGSKNEDPTKIYFYFSSFNSPNSSEIQ